MLDRDARTAILQLSQAGHGIRAIARALRVSRGAVRKVLRSRSAEVCIPQRESGLEPHLDQIRELFRTCKGNRIRVVEELEAGGIKASYSTLTHFCRRHGIGVKEKKPAGRYHFEPGVEMQHDTSPHTVEIGGRQRHVQCASLVLCFSRMLFALVYTRWRRFECKHFLTEAFKSFEGVAGRCMLDNSTVVMGSGSGADAVPAPEMAAFSERFDFKFVAHRPGDANRSARVERPFDYIDNNFYAGRKFKTLVDLNEQLRPWCQKANDRPKDTIKARPNERFAVERLVLRPLPIYIPEVYALHRRRVDVEGYVCFDTNRYSVPTTMIGRELEVRETHEGIRIFDGHRLVIEHELREPGAAERVTLPEHLGQRRRKKQPPPPLPQEGVLRGAAPELAVLVDKLRQQHGGRAARSMRQLYRLYVDYPLDPLVDVVRIALEFSLTDLTRIERMVLRQIAGTFFSLPLEPDPDDEDRNE